MRLTPAWLLLLLAIGIPAVLVQSAVMMSDRTEGLEGFAFLLLAMYLSAAALPGFGTLALMAARPNGALAKSLRWMALFAAGVLDLIIGGWAWSVTDSPPFTIGSLVWLGPLSLLVPLGLYAFYAILRDLSHRQATADSV